MVLHFKVKIVSSSLNITTEQSCKILIDIFTYFF